VASAISRCGGRRDRFAEFCPGGGGEADRIALVSAGVTIRVGSGFDAGELRRVLLVLRELG
jgi:hypothetical protein